jgi:hypothetical protein
MKLFKMAGAALFVTFLACKGKAPEQAPPFLPGMYVSQAENEFCRIVDTLIIQKTNLDGTAYQVTRKSAFQRIRQGEKMPVEYQGEEWQAGYDASRGVLLPATKAPEIRYSSEQNKVFKGEWEYEKVE